MGIKTYRPIPMSRRYYTVSDFSDLTRTEPHKPLTIHKKNRGGRNNLGRATVKGRGGGERKRFRIIDFKRDKFSIPGKVMSIEYDPNRSGRIALVLYRDGEYRYVLAPEGLKIGDEILSGRDVPIRIGNAMPLSGTPLGVEIHNIQLNPGAAGSLVRSAGLSAQILAKEGDYAHIKLPSGEVRLIRLDCFATIGRVSNFEHNLISIGKAGRSRHMGIRPTSRAVAKNPVDHPMGGGEGKSSGGRHPCSERGLLAKGKKTRNRKKWSTKYILARRK
jgi:large subunit ribosomal protein L2